jgi:hypothetical protein
MTRDRALTRSGRLDLNTEVLDACFRAAPADGEEESQAQTPSQETITHECSPNESLQLFLGLFGLQALLVRFDEGLDLLAHRK